MSRRRIYQTEAEATEANLRRAAERSRARSQSICEIGTPPAVENPERRESCRLALKLFLETYLANLFTADWSEAHLSLISELQTAILNPGQQVNIILPRGIGKTTLCTSALLWAALYEHSRYSLILSANSTAARQILLNIRSQLLFNPIIGNVDWRPDSDCSAVGGDFPEVTFPLRKIGSRFQRAAGQMINGSLTSSEISSERVVTPFIESGETQSGNCIIESSGLSAGLRGKNVTTRRGSTRPTLVLIDDAQTDKSAQSFTQTNSRLDLIQGGIAGLASAGQSLSILQTCTIIEQDDLPSRLLKVPEWRTIRYGIIDKLPTGPSLEKWDEYNRLRVDLLTANTSVDTMADELNDFYRVNRAILEEGSTPLWPAFKDPGYLDSRQKIMRLFYEKPRAFFREYLNNPAAEETLATTNTVNTNTLSGKIIRTPRGIAPLEVEHISIGVDSQTLGLFYSVIGTTDTSTNYLLDYGKLPTGRRTLTQLYKGLPLGSAIYAGYTEMLKLLFNKDFMREDGTPIQASKILIDAGHGETQPDILRFIRESKDARIIPCYGRSRATGSVFSAKRKPGEKRGDGWSLSPSYWATINGKRLFQPRHLIHDSAFFKSLLSSKIAASPGVVGGLSFLYDTAGQYQEFFEHLTAEKPVAVSGPAGSKTVWELKPGRQNHWLDSTVLALIGAQMGGNTTPSSQQTALANTSHKQRLSARERMAALKNK